MNSQPSLAPAAAAPVPNFDRLAHAYRWMEWFTFGPYLHRARCAFLPELIQARHALILGDGDGRFTADLLDLNPSIRIDAVDSSPAMLRVLLHRAGPNAVRVRTHTADARTWLASLPTTTQPYDLVITHFFLDCLTNKEIRTLARIIRLNLSPGAIWVVSDFAIPPGAYGNVIARPLVSLLYTAFGFLTGLRTHQLPDYSNAIRYSGFILAARKTNLGGLVASELWQKRQRDSDANVTAVLKSAG